MNIIEVKNNLVKLMYEEDIKLSSFIKITDNNKSYIAQILYLESSRIGKTAIARLIFNFDNGIKAYDGSIPSIQSVVDSFEEEFFLSQIDKTNPVLLGKLSQKDVPVIVSDKLFEDKSVICAEKFSQSSILLENIIKQNNENNRQTVVFDLSGEVKGEKLTASKDFKLPLNSSTLNYIFDRGFEDATAENRAFIQDIFSELSDYVKTVEFIPFSDFSAVIDYEFKRTQLLQLIILKNRLQKFDKHGVFALEEKDFRILDEKLKSTNTLIIDISKLEDSLQTEYISYVYSQIEKMNKKMYSIVSLTNLNTNKVFLTDILNSINIKTSVVCPYSFNFMQDLKRCSKNMFMFTPLKQQNDFGAYNIFLNKLSEDEFIIYGKTTKFVPLIVKLEEINDFSGVIKKDNFFDNANSIKVDNIFATPIEKIEPEQIVQPSTVVPVVEPVDVEPKATENENNQEIIEESPKVSDEVVETQDEIKQEEQTDVQPELEQVETVVEDNSEKTDIADDEISDAVVSNIEVEDSLLDDFLSDDEPVEEVVSESSIVEDSPQEQNSEVEEPPVNLSENSEEENTITDEDLTDADLDMIESISVQEEGENEVNPKVNEDVGINEEVNAEPLNTPEENIVESVDVPQQNEEIDNPEEIPNQEETEPSPKRINHREEALETKPSVTAEVPVYSAEIPDEDIVESDPLQQGDRVNHSEFGDGVVEKIINYGDRTLCSVNFEQVGRRLLDPKISEMHKI